MSINPMYIFQRNERYDGVRRINIYLLRLLYVLMFFVLGRETWLHILTHQGPWDPNEAVAWCVWTAFATLAGIGIIHPVKMLPIVLLEIFYKVLWLGLVAYPLWSHGTLAGSSAEGTTAAFLWVPLPIVAVPWGYVLTNYFWKPKKVEVVRPALKVA
ncbi:MAG: hypothetical protein ABSC33_19960 [Candidatus Sulfotelmatobacter sp.]|jgi:hypothetical protein